MTTGSPVAPPGGLITLTINHTDADRVLMTVTSTVTDSQGNVSAPGSVNVTIDGGTVNVVSNPARVWTIVAATLNQTVLTATA
jgi:hypothetical protein